MSRRVVVTGLGAITPIGNSVEEFWNSLKEKKVGIGPITYFDTADYKANLAAQAAMKPGMRFCDIDKVARDIITEAGYGPNFTHRLGHCIGIEVHDAGDVSSINTDVVEEGMIFSCEPGIYLPGELGVRIEDLMLMTKDGAVSLNHVSKELEVIE